MKENAFDKLFEEANTFAKRKKKKKKTLAESRTSREKRTSLALIKQQVNERTDKIVEGSLKPHHLKIFVETTRCKGCSAESRRISHMEVWSKTTHKVLDPFRLTARPTTEVQFSFCKDLPRRIVETTIYRPICVECLESEANASAPKEKKEHEVINFQDLFDPSVAADDGHYPNW